MSPYEQAMNMELDGRKYFEEQAAKMTDPTLKRIFEELGRDEEKHYKIFKIMSEGTKIESAPSLTTDIIATTNSIFQQMRDSHTKLEEYPANVKDVWKQARDIEDQADKFYREQAEKCSDDNEKKTWLTIANEEHKHWVALNNVVSFLERPNRWLEDAEWQGADAE